jgi:hypothetical protein
MAVRIDHAVTSGTFSLDGQTFDVDNNARVVGGDAECVVIDAPHDVEAILTVVGDRSAGPAAPRPSGAVGRRTSRGGARRRATARAGHARVRQRPSRPAHAGPQPGACRSYSDFPTIGAEAPHLDEWIARGH